MEDSKTLTECEYNVKEKAYIIKIYRRCFENKENAESFLRAVMRGAGGEDFIDKALKKIHEEYERELKKYKELLKKYESTE